MIPVIVLIAVFILITVRRIGRFKMEIWQIMLAGAVIDILFTDLTFTGAIKIIDWNIIIFLFCMFSLGALLEISGYLNSLYNKIFYSENIEKNMYMLALTSAFLSAAIMNDTVAVIMIPAIIHLSKKYSISVKPFAMIVAFSVTVGSVFSPIGNPQNLLIALSGKFKEPFLSFIRYLFIPSVINILIVYFAVRLKYSKEIKKNLEVKRTFIKIKKGYLYFLSKFSIALLFSMIIIKIYMTAHGKNISLITVVAVSSFPALFLSFNQFSIFKMIDWKTLIFFASMFIVTGSAWESGYIQTLIKNENILNLKYIFIISIIASQFISNVPLVALLSPLILSAGGTEKEMIALACSSTIAGNLTILGAASNVIIMQNLESRKAESVSPLEFFILGIPVTLINAVIYYLFII